MPDIFTIKLISQSITEIFLANLARTAPDWLG